MIIKCVAFWEYNVIIVCHSLIVKCLLKVYAMNVMLSVHVMCMTTVNWLATASCALWVMASYW